MLEYTDSTLDEALAQWQRFGGFVDRAGEKVGQPSLAEVRDVALPAAFVEAMDDDLGVPRAMAVIHETMRAGNAALAAGDTDAVGPALLAARAMLDVLGLDPLSPDLVGGTDSAVGGVALGALDSLVQADIAARAAARAAKDWAAADAIRDRLAAAGIAIEDAPDGARWSLVTDA